MKRRLFLIPLCGFSFLSTACFSDDGSWREKFGTPSLLLENAMDICNVYPYDDMQIQYRDEDCLIKNKLKEVEVFNEDFPNKKLGDVRYFTFEAEWVPATSGPNYEHLIVHENGYVQIHHKASLGRLVCEYFYIDEAKALEIVDFVFSTCNFQ